MSVSELVWLVVPAALPLANRVYLTRVHATIAGDTIFPALDPGEWRLFSAEDLPRGPKDDHDATLQIFERHPPA